MGSVVVDTSVLIARADADDPHNEVATEVISGIDQGRLPTGRVTNYLVLETLNWIHTRQRHAKAVDAYNRLHTSAGFEIVQCAQKDFGRAVEYFETYDGLSFGDATIAAYMDRTDLEYLYSFDADFDALDHVARLDTPTDPFS